VNLAKGTSDCPLHFSYLAFNTSIGPGFAQIDASNEVALEKLPEYF
jgi:hypothetical protein